MALNKKPQKKIKERLENWRKQQQTAKNAMIHARSQLAGQ